MLEVSETELEVVASEDGLELVSKSGVSDSVEEVRLVDVPVSEKLRLKSKDVVISERDLMLDGLVEGESELVVDIFVSGEVELESEKSDPVNKLLLVVLLTEKLVLEDL